MTNQPSKYQPAKSRILDHCFRAAGAFALAMCLAAGIRAQDQGQQGQSQDQQTQGQQAQDQDQDQQQGQPSQDQQAQGQPTQDQPQQPAQEPQAQPKYPSQDADKPPYNKDRRAQSGPSGPSGPDRQDQAPPMPREREDAPRAATSLRSVLTIPAGTVLRIRTNDFLSSDHNQVGDQFTAVLDEPIVVNGWVVARRGQTLIGKVMAAQKAGRVKGVSQLGLELTDLTVVDGRQLPILTELWKGSGGTSHGQDAATIAGTTGLGAAIGAAADWGRGAAIGAGVGAAAGIGAVLLTRGRPTVVPPEAPLTFRLVDPVKVDTAASHQAFLPVTQRDYEAGQYRRPRLRPAPYPPCGYYRPCYPYLGPAYFVY